MGKTVQMKIDPQSRPTADLNPDALLNLGRFSERLGPAEVADLYRHLTAGRELPSDLSLLLSQVEDIPASYRPTFSRQELVGRLLPGGLHEAEAGRRELLWGSLESEFRRLLSPLSEFAPLPAGDLLTDRQFSHPAGQRLLGLRRIMVRAVGDHLAADVASSGNTGPRRILTEYFGELSDPRLPSEAWSLVSRADQVFLLDQLLTRAGAKPSNQRLDPFRIGDIWTSEIKPESQDYDRKYLHDLLLNLLAVRS